MRNGFHRTSWVAAWLFLFAFPEVVRAEGSDQLGTTQEIYGSTSIYIDVLDTSNETIRWIGTGSSTLYNPSNVAVASLQSGGEYKPQVAGQYKLSLSTVQLIGVRWDIAVLVSGIPTLGRVHSPVWIFSVNNYTDGIDGSVYIMVPGGNGTDTGVVEIKMDGFAGYDYSLIANRSGLTNASGRSQFFTTTPAPTVNAPYYELYLNPPTRSTAKVLVPVITDASFNAGTNGLSCQSIDPEINRGSFRFTANVEGGYWLTCDLNDDGLFNPVGSEDTSRSGLAEAGVNVVEWDGRRNDGTALPNGTHECELRVTVGDVHFLANDVETSYGGFRMYALARANDSSYTRAPLPMWWNDEFVQSMEGVMPNGQKGAVSSGANGLDSGAYTASASPGYVTSVDARGLPTGWSGNARAWGAFASNGASKGNAAWLDTYTCLESSNVFRFDVTIDDGTTDTDGDFVFNVVEACVAGSDPTLADTDGDGLSDTVETMPNGGGPATFIDSDGDGLPDARDLDSNNNGLSDAIEGGGDTDNDGVPNFRDGIVVITTPAYVADSTPTIKGTVALATMADVSVDGVRWCDDTVVNAQGAFSCETPSGIVLKEGTHAVAVEALDRSGPIVGAKTVVVDLTAPTVTFDIRDLTIETKPQISGATEGDTAADVFVDGELICVTTADTNGRFSCGWPPSRSALTVEEHTVSVQLTDKAGNCGTGTMKFVVDAVDECAKNTDNCDANAICTNAVGGFTCACKGGYSGNGVSCTDVDECAKNTDNCDTNATCANAVGGFACACNSGYSGSGVSCTDVDECTLNTANCDVNATCTNAAGGFTCACNSGYSGSGVTCIEFIIIEPEADALIDDNTPVVSGTGEPGLAVTITIDGAPGCASTISSKGRFSCELPEVTDGEHQVTARNALAGIRVDRTFVVDTAPSDVPDGGSNGGGAPAEGSSAEGSPDEAGGCGCRVPNHPPSSSQRSLVVIGLGALTMLRRRRRD